jgi:uncharacterized membrane protein YjdF
MEYTLVLTALYLFFFTNYNKWFIVPVFALSAFIKYLHYYDKKINLKIPPHFYTLGLIAIYLNSIFGEFFLELYYTLPYYDKFLHFFIPLYLVLVVNFLMRNDLRYKELWVFLSVMGLSTMWEIFEFAADTISGTTVMQGIIVDLKKFTGGLIDTMKDLIYAMIGTIAGIIISKKSKK